MIDASGVTTEALVYKIQKPLRSDVVRHIKHECLMNPFKICETPKLWNATINHDAEERKE